MQRTAKAEAGGQMGELKRESSTLGRQTSSHLLHGKCSRPLLSFPKIISVLLSVYNYRTHSKQVGSAVDAPVSPTIPSFARSIYDSIS